MKKRPKKLSLSRETILQLQNVQLRRAAGGTNMSEYVCSWTDCSDVCLINNGCDTTGNTQCCTTTNC